MNDYQTIIGLEVHVQLATLSKLFCGCATTFGAEPNTQTCPVCLGLPGSLPVLNERAVQLAIETGVALNCTIPEFTKWDRKQYFYPDLPKGYQTSQFDLPITEHGWLEIAGETEGTAPKRVRITRAHLEEDAGKSLHDESAAGGDSVIDLNRAGTPLLEIVSEPDLRSSAEAKAYLNELKLLLTFLGVSDCNMQEGSLRVDANVNLHVPDSANPAKPAATPIVEIKNLNSFRAVERAIDYEAGRQWRHWQETGLRMGQAPKQTRGWDDSAEVTRAQREKEESADYRYFPCPDLAPVVITADEVTRVRVAMPELPAALRLRLQTEHGLSAYDADVIVGSGRELTEFYEQVAATGGDAKQAANWVTQHVTRVMNATGKLLSELQLPAESLGRMIAKIVAGELPSSRARDVFDLLLEQGVDVDKAMASLGIAAVDESELIAICRTLLAANPKIVADVQAGKQQAVGALIGQAKQKNPNADPGRVRAICLELIAAG
ncbi:Asp-tRNA(Asn)/Glu-tRNA(Gln) amidotransferase subunit GatB [Botrimarina hoheduenensis]|uniref:Aspartyl/glutamyl-tRNA(Asn/Gln) amidotransferase subunit B n=1 Tax=Botrimarina hoheduenensis TaxID=2528000 RepID=A0A5C5VWM0_9BACT|nr:Asp-tRNA(Asn)/Glu-tRNA(Gln) amidotransferase subunit GatB [Botrimarina hoheduenensis]TWT42924.1 Aspartyl/glutamyl-tRNA(Asn/Gln) amidotransferase subunit B [Botrimarina hoheduenensis]